MSGTLSMLKRTDPAPGNKGPSVVGSLLYSESEAVQPFSSALLVRIPELSRQAVGHRVDSAPGSERVLWKLTVLFAFALLLCQLGLQLSLVGSQAAVHLLLLLQLLAELRHTGAQLGAPEHARTEELNTSTNSSKALIFPAVVVVYGAAGVSVSGEARCSCVIVGHSDRVGGWRVTYFFSRLCLSLVISETRCSRLSQRSSVSLNLAFMLFTCKDKVSRKTH